MSISIIACDKADCENVEIISGINFPDLLLII